MSLPLNIPATLVLGAAAVLLVKVSAKLGRDAGHAEGRAEGIAEGRALGYDQATDELESDNKLAYQRGTIAGLTTRLEGLAARLDEAMRSIRSGRPRQLN